MYTTSTAILEALREAGMEYIFANLGSDHSGFLESIAAAEAAGNRERFPALVTCPDEMVALSAAHGFAVPDNPPYDAAADERHWAAMTDLFGSALPR